MDNSKQRKTKSGSAAMDAFVADVKKMLSIGPAPWEEPEPITKNQRPIAQGAGTAAIGRSQASPTPKRPSIKTPVILTPYAARGAEPQRRDYPVGATGNSLYNKDWLAYNRNRPVNRPSMVFDRDTISKGLGTGWAGLSSAIWDAPVLRDYNAANNVYDAGDYKDEPGYKTAYALGTGGRDALMAAGAAKVSGLGMNYVPVPFNPGLTYLPWWNQDIGNKVPLRDALAYEIGQNTRPNEVYAKYQNIEDAAERGRRMVDEMKIGKALLNNDYFKAFNLKGTFGTGPTPAARVGLRGGGLAAFLASEYYGNQPMWDAGWDDAKKSLR